MELAFLNIGSAEIILIIVAIIFIIVIGRYGQDTVFGYWGSILLAIFTTPLIAFIILSILKANKRR